MTLLVRCFNRNEQCATNSKSPRSNENQNQVMRRRDEKTLTQSSSTRHPRPTRSSTTTESSVGAYMPHARDGRELPVDEDGKIEPYVDFGPFYKLWNARMENSDRTCND